MRVHRDFQWGGHGAGSGSCDVDAECVIVVWVYATDSLNDPTSSNVLDPIVLHFVPVSETSTTAELTAPE